MSSVATTDRVPTVVKSAYALGALGPAMAGSTIIFFFMIFLTNVAGLPPLLAGTVLLIAKLWDAVNDPIIGWLSDKTRTRIGRRLPWIAASTLPFAALFALQWWIPPTDGNTTLTFAYFVVVVIVFRAVYTALTLPHQALTAELTRDYDERTRLSGFRQFADLGGSVLGLVVAMGVFAWLADAPPSTQFFGLGAVIALAVVVTMPVSLLGIWRAARKADWDPGGKEVLHPYEGVKIALRNRPFRMVAGIFLCSWLALQFTATILPYYVTNWMGLPYSEFNKLAITVQGTGLLLIPFWSWLAVRWGKNAVYLAGMSFWLVAQGVLFFLPNDELGAVYGLAVMAGIGVSVCYLIPFAMLPDVIELDELETGERREGVFYGMLVFLQKGALALGTFIVGLVLQLAGFQPTGPEGIAPEQPESALFAIRVAIGPLPAAVLLLGMWLTTRYPINKEKHAEIRSKLARKKSDGAG